MAQQKTKKIEVRLAREMTLFQVTMIGVGAMIGAGIFVLTGIAAGVAGPGLILAFLINGLIALLTAMAYAELGSAYPEAGGGYLWVKEALPGPNGFLSGWMSWFAHAVACSLYSLGFGAYFLETLKYLRIQLPIPEALAIKVLAVIVILAFGYINFKGASETGKAGALVSVGKVIILLVFIVLGLWVVFHKPNWEAVYHPFLPKGWGGVFLAMGLTYIAFEGYEVIAQSGEEIENPKRRIPIAIFLSLAIVVPIYVLVAFVSLGVVESGSIPPYEFLGRLKELAIVNAARHIFKGGGVMILVGGLLSTLSALNATIYSSSRVSFAMGRDRALPHFLSKVHPKTKSPHWAIVFSALIILWMALALPIEDVASAADIMFLLLFVQVNIALIKLREKRPDLDRGFRVPAVPFIPYLAVVLQVLIALYLLRLSPKAWISAALWIGVGVGIYRVYARHRILAHVPGGRIYTETRYRVLVPVANPAHVPFLIHLAAIFAREHNGEVVGLFVSEVPPNHPLYPSPELVERGEKLLMMAQEIAHREGVPFHPMVTITHRLSYGILSTAREENVQLILMGRAKRRNLWDRMFNTLFDAVLQDAPCPVMIVRPGPQEPQRFVFPLAPNPSTRRTAELIRPVAQHYQVPIHCLVVTDPKATPKLQRVFVQSIEKILGPGVPVEIEEVRSTFTEEAILRVLKPTDWVWMGMGRGGPWERFLLGSIPENVADRTENTVFMVSEPRVRKRRLSVLWKVATSSLPGRGAHETEES